MDLPTVEECRTFLDTINRGRVAIELESIDKLEFDECEPASPYNCLSARHLFCTLEPGYAGESVRVSDLVVYNLPPVRRVALSAALDTRTTDLGGLVIPPEIRAVTDPFDACDLEYAQARRALAALRARMVEAGVVDP